MIVVELVWLCMQLYFEMLCINLILTNLGHRQHRLQLFEYMMGHGSRVDFFCKFHELRLCTNLTDHTTTRFNLCDTCQRPASHDKQNSLDDDSNDSQS
jgi:hypothetical protein